MELCAYRHDEIVYDSRRCPLCDAMKEIGRLEEELKIAEEETDALRFETATK